MVSVRQGSAGKRIIPASNEGMRRPVAGQPLTPATGSRASASNDRIKRRTAALALPAAGQGGLAEARGAAARSAGRYARREGVCVARGAGGRGDSWSARTRRLGREQSAGAIADAINKVSWVVYAAPHAAPGWTEARPCWRVQRRVCISRRVPRVLQRPQNVPYRIAYPRPSTRSRTPAADTAPCERKCG